MRIIIFNAKIIQKDIIIPAGYLVVEDGLIVSIAAGKPQEEIGSAGTKWIDAQEGYLVPGFIDLHVHGVGKCDLYRDTEKAAENLAGVLATQGVTGFLATLPTAPFKKMVEATAELADKINKADYSGAQILGINLEGPYLNPERCGAQPAQYIRKPDTGELRELLAAAQGQLKIVTLAPEIPGNLELAALLKENGVIPAIGHTLANYEETLAAVDNGLEYVTHLFNAMPPFHHREPGVVGAALKSEAVTVEIIADGIHVHPAMIELVLREKDRRKIVMVSDCLAGLEQGEGEIEFAGKKTISNGHIARTESGSLQGSVTPLNLALANIIKHSRLDLTEAIKLATINPATVLGLAERKGTLAVGKDAALTILTQDFQIITINK